MLRKAQQTLEKDLTSTAANSVMKTQIRHFGSDVSQGTVSAEVARNVILISKDPSASTINDIKDTTAVANSSELGHGKDCITRSVRDGSQQEHASETHREHDPCRRNGQEPWSRLSTVLGVSSEDTLVMIVDAGAEIRVVCERHTYHDCTTE